MTIEIVLASGNQGKLQEFQTLLAKTQFRVLPQSDFAVVGAEETGLSYVENAIIKARHASHCTGLPAIADDSGLEVDYLNGAPGIYSARFAGESASDQDNNSKLLKLMENIPENQRSARFQCVLVYMRNENDPAPTVCQGTWEGRVLTRPRGKHGFGYDPLFYALDQGCSSAQLPAQKKNLVSHRARAMLALLNIIHAMTPEGMVLGQPAEGDTTQYD